MTTNFLNLFEKAINDPLKGWYVLKNRHLTAWKNHLFRTFGHEDFKRFIILTRGRTGSNLLVSYLNSHPDIFAQGEIFSHVAQKDWRKVLDTNFKKQPHYVKAYGFKIFYYHPLDRKECQIWDRLAEYKPLHIIHLKRRNILRAAVSGEIAKNEKVWSTASACRVKNKITLSEKRLAGVFKRTRMWESDWPKKFKAHPILDVYYEDLTSDTVRTFRKITDFLDLPYVKPRTVLKKQNPEKARNLIDNYDELEKAFQGTVWHEFFDK